MWWRESGSDEVQDQTRFRIRRDSGPEEIQDQKRFRIRRDSVSEEIQYQKRVMVQKESGSVNQVQKEIRWKSGGTDKFWA